MSTAEPAAWQVLREWCAAHAGLRLGPAEMEQLRRYVDVLLLWTRKLALVSQHDPAAIIAKHVADSLFAAGRCADGVAVLDMGSGAGFPGLPIAVARPAVRVVLVESRGRKASFLEEACRVAPIRNARVCNARLEALAGDPAHRGSYDVVTARAIGSARDVLALARPFASPGGRIVMLRAVEEPRELDPRGAEIVSYVLPDGTPRRLVIANP